MLAQEPVIRIKTIASTVEAEELKNCKRGGTISSS